MRKDASHLYLLSDMDDTLLSTDKSVCSRNREAIAHFQACGGHFSVATGRAPCTASHYLNGILVNGPSVLINGGLIYRFDTGETLFPHYMPPDYQQVVRRLAEHCPEVGIEVITQAGIHVARYNEVIHRHIGAAGFEYFSCAPDALPKQAFKVLFGVVEPQMEGFMQLADRLSHEGLYFVRTFSEYYEMLPTGINKGMALGQLRSLLRPGDQLAAIGDYYNDVELLRQADFSFAVGNAPDDIKALAQRVTCTNNEGAVADAIDYLLQSC